MQPNRTTDDAVPEEWQWGVVNERQFFQRLNASAKGWRATKRGWPDYLCFAPDGRIIGVEVKRRMANGRLQCLRESQARTMEVLERHGIQCFVSDGESFERYDRIMHTRPEYRDRLDTWPTEIPLAEFLRRDTLRAMRQRP